MGDPVFSSENDMVTFDAVGSIPGKYKVLYVHAYSENAVAGTDKFRLNDKNGKLICRGIADQAYLDKYYPCPKAKKDGLHLDTLVGTGIEITVVFDV